MKKVYKIAFLLISLTIPFFMANGQNLPVACGGSKVRYGVTGLPGSNFKWNIDGGIINNIYNDSIDVTWNNIQGIHELTVTEYTVTNCVANPDTVLVLVNIMPNPNLGGPLNVCQGQSINIGTSVSYDKPSFLWNTGSTSSSISASTQGWYEILVTDSAGCFTRDSAYLSVNALPIIPLSKDTTIIGTIGSLTLNAGSGDLNYLWNNGQNSQEIDIISPGTYWVSVTSIDGCSKTDTIIVKESAVTLTIKIPNAFTPNNDGENDNWDIQELNNYPNASVEVYDRWGRMVFQAKNGYPSPGWDGTSRGKNLPMDSYFYNIKLNDGSTTKFKGSVTIIR